MLPGDLSGSAWWSTRGAGGYPDESPRPRPISASMIPHLTRLEVTEEPMIPCMAHPELLTYISLMAHTSC